MSSKPVFVATHPRACSTAFERVFMTRRDTLKCLHEPFGDAFYYGLERLSDRFKDDEAARIKSGFDKSTYQTIFERIEREGNEGKRLLIKDMIYYLVPPERKPPAIAPSLQRIKRGVGTTSNGFANGDHPVDDTPYPFATASESHNPTVVPSHLLEKFHFTFLIRDPHSSIPSYFRCTVPPLDDVTGFYDFMPSEAGYDEVRRMFEYLRSIGLVGPDFAANRVTNGETNGMANGVGNGESNGETYGITNGVGNGESNGVNCETTNGYTHGTSQGDTEICVIDADDLLDNPSGVVSAFCKSVGIPFEPEMLNWDNKTDQQVAVDAFEKWPGFHNDALDSKELKQRTHAKKAKEEHEWDADWRKKYGEKGAKIIRETVDKNMADYLYMKQFAIKV